MVENKEISHWYNFCLFSHYWQQYFMSLKYLYFVFCEISVFIVSLMYVNFYNKEKYMFPRFWACFDVLRHITLRESNYLSWKIYVIISLNLSCKNTFLFLRNWMEHDVLLNSHNIKSSICVAQKSIEATAKWLKTFWASVGTQSIFETLSQRFHSLLLLLQQSFICLFT